ncbi:hypothetical protein [Pseudomonas sp. NPDC087639]|uniref:hypothetical protein n=1 Tax=Pseudomonas sp. NPDC087639 TaxID=3364445 RepID=UPI00381650E3
MDKVLSFPKIETPYQSCWLIVVKALIINRISLKAVLENLGDVEYGAAPTSNLGLYHENLVLNLNKRLQLSRITLRQARISSKFHLSSQSRAQTIRHCQDCIANNFHSSLFQNPLLEKCPVHDQELTYCRCCTSALRKGGSLFTKPLIKNSTCEHLRFLALERVPIVKLSEKEVRAFEMIGDNYQEWLDKIECLDLGAVSEVISKISGMRDLEVSEFYFEYVRRRIGIPFDLYWQSAKFSHEVSIVNYASIAAGVDGKKFRDAGSSSFSFDRLPTVRAPGFDVGDIVTCLKSLRRHLFKLYISEHRECFNSIKSLSHSQLNALSLSSGCTCVSAYCAWLVSSGGVSTLAEYQAIRSSSAMMELFSDLLARGGFSLRELLVTQLVSFFDVWGALERASANRDKYSDVIVARDTIPTISFVYMNASYTLIHREEAGGNIQKEKSYIVSPPQLKAQSQERCSLRKNSSSKFVAVLDRNIFVPSAHGIMRFVDGLCDFHNSLVIRIW